MVRPESVKTGSGPSKRGSLTSTGSKVGPEPKSGTPDRSSLYRLSAGSKNSQKKDLSEISVT